MNLLRKKGIHGKNKNLKTMRDIKFRAWNKKDKLMLPWSTIRQSAFNNSKDGFGLLYQILVTRREDFHLMQYTGLKDKEGKEIYEGEKFKFKFLKKLNNEIELIGSFDWNDRELRYEIDIHNHEYYACLSYDPSVMRGFEVIGNIHDNPELLNTD